MYGLKFSASKISVNRDSQKRFLTFALAEFEKRLGKQAMRFYHLEEGGETIDHKKSEFAYWGNIPAIQMQDVTFLFGKPIHDYLRTAIMEKFSGSEHNHVREVFRAQAFERINKEWLDRSGSTVRDTPKKPLDFDDHYYQWIMGIFQPMADTILYHIYDHMVDALDLSLIHI